MNIVLLVGILYSCIVVVYIYFTCFNSVVYNDNDNDNDNDNILTDELNDDQDYQSRPIDSSIHNIKKIINEPIILPINKLIDDKLIDDNNWDAEWETNFDIMH